MNSPCISPRRAIFSSCTLLVPFEETRFSDNYFDLGAGQRRTIRVTNAARPLTPGDVTVRCC